MVEVTYTVNVVFVLLLVASTFKSAFPIEYSANWIDTVSIAIVGVAGTRDGVALTERVAVLVAVAGRVAVGVKAIGVADGRVAVGNACVAFGVGVRVGV